MPFSRIAPRDPDASSLRVLTHNIYGIQARWKQRREVLIAACELAFDEPMDGLWGSDYIAVVADLVVPGWANKGRNWSGRVGLRIRLTAVSRHVVRIIGAPYIRPRWVDFCGRICAVRLGWHLAEAANTESD